MTWHVFLYNRVRDVVVESVTLADDEPVPDSTFNNLRINGELDGYYLTFNRKDHIHWGWWNKKKGEWLTPVKIPETLQMIKMVLHE